MKLENWLRSNAITPAEFARQLGKNGSQIHKYLGGENMPGKAAMQQIYLLTRSGVSANDFYDLSEQLFEPLELIAPAVPSLLTSSSMSMRKNGFQWKGRIISAFEHLEASGEKGGEQFNLKAAAIHWLTSDSANLKLACSSAGFELDEVKEQAIRILASQPGAGIRFKDWMH